MSENFPVFPSEPSLSLGRLITRCLHGFILGTQSLIPLYFLEEKRNFLDKRNRRVTQVTGELWKRPFTAPPHEACLSFPQGNRNWPKTQMTPPAPIEAQEEAAIQSCVRMSSCGVASERQVYSTRYNCSRGVRPKACLWVHRLWHLVGVPSLGTEYSDDKKTPTAS